MNNYKNILVYILSLLFLILISCRPHKRSDYPPEPEIHLISATGNRFNFTDETSGILFEFTLLDGDKDMGLSAKDSVFIFEDYRSDTLYQALYLGLPQIPRETISGPTLRANVEIPLRSFYFVPRGDAIHTLSMSDTLIFKIYCVDDAGNKSNIVTSDTIYISP